MLAGRFLRWRFAGPTLWARAWHRLTRVGSRQGQHSGTRLQVAAEKIQHLRVRVREFGKVLRADDRLIDRGDLPTALAERLRCDGGGIEPIGEYRID